MEGCQMRAALYGHYKCCNVTEQEDLKINGTA